MNQKILIPVIVALSVAFSSSTAVAGMVFDFIPRLDFAPVQEVVTKDKPGSVLKCVETSSSAGDCQLNSKTRTVDVLVEPKK